MTLCEAHAHFVRKKPGGPNSALGTQHNGQQGQDHSMSLRSGVADSAISKTFIFIKSFDH
jgi:hypothetical protein